MRKQINALFSLAMAVVMITVIATTVSGCGAGGGNTNGGSEGNPSLSVAVEATRSALTPAASPTDSPSVPPAAVISPSPTATPSPDVTPISTGDTPRWRTTPTWTSNFGTGSDSRSCLYQANPTIARGGNVLTALDWNNGLGSWTYTDVLLPYSSQISAAVSVLSDRWGDDVFYIADVFTGRILRKDGSANATIWQQLESGFSPLDLATKRTYTPQLNQLWALISEGNGAFRVRGYDLLALSQGSVVSEFPLTDEGSAPVSITTFQQWIVVVYPDRIVFYDHTLSGDKRAFAQLFGATVNFTSATVVDDRFLLVTNQRTENFSSIETYELEASHALRWRASWYVPHPALTGSYGDPKTTIYDAANRCIYVVFGYADRVQRFERI